MLEPLHLHQPLYARAQTRLRKTAFPREKKDYFVLTTNVDHCFQKAGFDKHRLFYTQGDYGLLQCSKPCHQSTYDNEELVKKRSRHKAMSSMKRVHLPYWKALRLKWKYLQS